MWDREGEVEYGLLVYRMGIKSLRFRRENPEDFGSETTVGQQEALPPGELARNGWKTAFGRVAARRVVVVRGEGC